jgi:hypothetical protein
LRWTWGGIVGNFCLLGKVGNFVGLPCRFFGQVASLSEAFVVAMVAVFALPAAVAVIVVVAMAVFAPAAAGAAFVVVKIQLYLRQACVFSCVAPFVVLDKNRLKDGFMDKFQNEGNAA